MKKYVMITGGELFNKGAQAMTFSVISAIKKINPEIVCVLLSTKDYMERSKEEKDAYDFLILPYRIKEIFCGIGKKTVITGILKNCSMMLDISGYVLSSDWGKRRCQSFLLKILIAKIYSIPVYIMPQSYGPFEFKGMDSFLIDRMIRYIMPYPNVIYAREKQGFQLLTEKYGLHNVKKSLDMVLLNGHIDAELIYKSAPEKKTVQIPGNSVGIIPNKRTIEHGSRERILALYIQIIAALLNAGKNVYLISHSADDEGLCEELKDKYAGESRIIYLRQEFSCIEFEDVIRKFEYVIASRYHAVIHAYKHAVPCIILGWAVKYQEVAGIFGQDEYIFQISGDFSGKNIIKAINKMDMSYEKEAETIKEKLEKYRKGNIFGFLEQLREQKKMNIASVCEESICVGCGACAGVCPVPCIKMSHNTAGFLRAYINKEKCCGCGKCTDVCPQISDFGSDRDCGKITGFLAYARNPKIRLQGQSGGAVTAILEFLLDKQEVEGVIVNRYHPETQVNEPCYIENSRDLPECAGSYYSQSDVCRVIQEHKEKTVAAVLLGCQSRSVSMSKNHVQYKIGLICESQYSRFMGEDLIKASKLRPHEITHFRWRDKTKGGWPGNVKIETKQGETVLKSKYRVRLKNVYKNFACSLCQDKMNAHADIVCGDPWGITCGDKKKGYTCLIARTEKGLRLLRDAQKEGYIELQELEPERIIVGQKVDEGYYRDKNKMIHFCDKKQWAYPKYLKKTGKFGGMELPDKRTINQLLYEKKLYGCTSPSGIKRILFLKKMGQMTIEFRQIPGKILFKLGLIKVGKK